MSESVIASIDTGADISADTGAGGTGGAGAGEAALPANAGAGNEGQRAAAEGGSENAAGADGQHAPGSAAKDEGGKLVSLAALQESREIVKALKAEIATLAAQPKLSAEDAELLKDLRAQKKVIEQPKDPDFLEDPKGYVDTKLTQTKDALKKLDEANEQRTQQEQNQQEVTQLVNNVASKEQEFLKTTPDYYDAVIHIRTVRASQLQMLYPTATPDQITRQLTIEEVGAARQILQGGGDPAQFAYNYAKTMGYAPKSPAAAAAPAVKETKIDKEAARSLGGGGGADSTGDEDENAMPEFAAAITERFNRGKRK